MSPKYWKSRKGKGFIKEQKQQLDTMLEYANTDLEVKSVDDLKTFGDRFIDLLTIENHSHKKLFDQSGGFDFFSSLHLHLRSRINAVIDAMLMLWEMPLWKMEQATELNANPLENQFTVNFVLDDSVREDPIKFGKMLIDFKLFELFSDLDLKPRRFRRCWKCKKFFYQPTSREKKYCSQKCAGAKRQYLYIKKKQKRLSEESDKK
jgi:hypothetical protein